jgi:hypothetical protein
MALLNDDLVFDDRKQKDIFCGSFTGQPFYADILKRWVSGIRLSDRERKIVTGILVLNPEYLPGHDKSEEVIEFIKVELQQPDVNNHGNPEKGLFMYNLFYFMLLQRKWIELKALSDLIQEYFVTFYSNLSEPPEPGKAAHSVLFSEEGDSDISVFPAPYEKCYIEIISRIMSRGEVLDLNSGFNISLLPGPPGIRLANCNGHSLRSHALELYHFADYEKASAVYRKMLVYKFEMPGTLAHLARLELTRGDLAQAEVFLINGWRLRSEAPSYVLVRILYLIVFMSMLRSVQFEKWLGCLKEVMNRPDSKMQWDMDRLLERYKKELTPDHFNLLKVLLKVLSGEDDEGELNKSEMWKTVTPIVFEAWPDYGNNFKF